MIAIYNVSDLHFLLSGLGVAFEGHLGSARDLVLPSLLAVNTCTVCIHQQYVTMAPLHGHGCVYTFVLALFHVRVADLKPVNIVIFTISTFKTTRSDSNLCLFTPI